MNASYFTVLTLITVLAIALANGEEAKGPEEEKRMLYWKRDGRVMAGDGEEGLWSFDTFNAPGL